MPELASFVTSYSKLSPVELSAMLLIDQRERWQADDRIPAEEYLTRFSEVAGDRNASTDLVYGEYLMRESLGEKPTLTEYERRFPEHAEALAAQIRLHRLISNRQDATRVIVETIAHDGAAVAEERPIVADLLKGIGGLFKIERLLGSGGMGHVYLARDLTLDRRVAIKLPRIDEKSSAADLERFQREARAVARVTHPNICGVHAAGILEGRPYLVLEYVPGETLTDALANAGALSQRQAVRLAIQVAHALEAAHASGILHRDIKPGNIMLRPDGEPVVMDFGLARLRENRDMRITQSDAFLGTPGYSSPEQLVGNHESLSAASDVYSLGVVLFQSVTGRMPFEGPIVSTINQALEADRPRISQFRPGVPRSLDKACQRAMAKTVDSRFSTMREFAEALEATVPDLPLEEEPWKPEYLGQAGAATVRFDETRGNGAPVGATTGPVGPRRTFGVTAGRGLAAAVLGAVLLGGWWATSGGGGAGGELIQPGTVWVGTFKFVPPMVYMGEARLTIANRDGVNIDGLYETEGKFWWHVAGTMRSDKVQLTLLDESTDGAPLAPKDRSTLEGEVRGDALELTFYDPRDQTAATMRLFYSNIPPRRPAKAVSPVKEVSETQAAGDAEPSSGTDEHPVDAAP